MTPFDVEYARRQFPAFSDARLEGWAHFENAGGSYACGRVIDRLTGFYRDTKVQPEYAFPLSVRAAEAMEESYQRLSAWMGVGAGRDPLRTLHLPEHLRAGPGFPVDVAGRRRDRRLHPGPRGQRRGVEAAGGHRREGSGVAGRSRQRHPGPGRPRPAADRAHPAGGLPPRLHVVAAINPVSDIAARAAEVGAVTVVDGVSYAPHGLPDLGALGADVYLFSGYKTWGPHQGVMFVRRELARRLGNEGPLLPGARRPAAPTGPGRTRSRPGGRLRGNRGVPRRSVRPPRRTARRPG